MAISRINVKYVSGVSSSYVDEEEKRIAAKLLEYGIIPTGNKTTDKAKLHEIEVKQAKSINYISNDFLTVSLSEQEEIQRRKAENKEQDFFPQEIEYKENFNGAQALGEQIFLTINMKEKRRFLYG